MTLQVKKRRRRDPERPTEGVVVRLTSAGAPDRKAIAVAGEPADAASVAAIVDALGFDPVVAGPLAEGVRFGPDTELFGANVAADEVRAMLDRFPDTLRGQLRLVSG